MDPEDALEAVKNGGALLVCAYEDEATYGKVKLEGSISIQEFRNRRSDLPKDLEVIFYCA